MEKFKKLHKATALKTNIETILSLSKECAMKIPVRVKAIDALYDTSEIAEMLLNGAYLLSHKYEHYVITAEDVAKVAGFNKLIDNGSGKIKIGRKTFMFTKSDENMCYPKTHKLEVLNGEVIEEVIPNKLDNKTKKDITKGQVVYAMKAKMSAEYVEGWFSIKGKDTVGVYLQEYGDKRKVLLVSSFDLSSGEDFYIYGQQHASKNERFTFVDMSKVRYIQLKKHQMMPPRAYSKGYLSYRSEGTFVAK